MKLICLYQEHNQLYIFLVYFWDMILDNHQSDSSLTIPKLLTDVTLSKLPHNSETWTIAHIQLDVSIMAGRCEKKQNIGFLHLTLQKYTFSENQVHGEDFYI